MGRIWINGGIMVNGSTADLLDFGTNNLRTLNAIQLDADGLSFIDGDGTDLRIGVKVDSDIIFMNGATDVAKINETGVTDLIP